MLLVLVEREREKDREVVWVRGWVVEMKIVVDEIERERKSVREREGGGREREGDTYPAWRKIPSRSTSRLWWFDTHSRD